MEPAKDRSVCRQIAELAAAKGVDCPVLEASQDTGAVVGLIRRADAVLAMRLHALIFAAAQGTPFAGVAYDPKITGFMDYMGQGLCCALEEADASRLCGLMDRLEESGDFETAARQLRALAAENCAEAFDLMNAHR
jgi:polysaccharide pyruvyl transferase WcaK-like protein